MNDPNDSRLSLDPEDEAQASGMPTRGRRAPARKTSAREPTRDPIRGGIVAVGRDGESLSRRRKDDGKDIFDLPDDMKEPGWGYQWCAVSVVGNEDILIDQNLMLAENGWRPVPADRWPGRFMPIGHKGSIVRGGQILMERPESLCEEAREENYSKAVRQMRDRDEALMGGKANLRNNVSNGLELRERTAYKGRRTQMGIDNAYDIPAPKHELAEPGQ